MAVDSSPVRRAFAALASCFVLGAGVAAADRVRPGRALAGATFRAGESVTLDLHLDERAFDEFEVLLSLDGGRTYPVRLTRDLPASTRRVIVSVPALVAREARLLVRAGGDDAEEGGRAERDVWTSDVFRIETDRVALPARDEGLLPRRGESVRVEWWPEPPPSLRQALDLSETSAERGPGEVKAGRARRFRVLLRTEPGLPGPRDAGAGRVARRERPRGAGETRTAGVSSPLEFPLRP